MGRTGQSRRQKPRAAIKQQKPTPGDTNTLILFRSVARLTRRNVNSKAGPLLKIKFLRAKLKIAAKRTQTASPGGASPIQSNSLVLAKINGGKGGKAGLVWVWFGTSVFRHFSKLILHRALRLCKKPLGMQPPKGCASLRSHGAGEEGSLQGGWKSHKRRAGVLLNRKMDQDREMLKKNERGK